MSDIAFNDTNFIKAEQWKLLRAQLDYISINSPYYQRLFKERSIDIDTITSFNDLHKLPVTSKEDLQRYNHDFIAVSEEDIIDLVTTSGTLGSPVNFALNDSDLDRLAENEYRSFKLAGVTKADKVQITTTLDRRFMAGLAYFLGLRKLGAGIIRTGSGLPQLQWESIDRFKPNFLVAVPSFLLKMIEYAIANNIDYRSSSVKKAICIGEPLQNDTFELNALGKKITELWDIELFSTYASTEMSTAFTECTRHEGHHVPLDLIYTEILDDHGKHVKPGEIGELVVTPLGTQTMPLLRFTTGDMLAFTAEACECGRNSPRLYSLTGRKQQKIKFKGTSLYPQHIIEVLNSYGKVPVFIIEAGKDAYQNDTVKIRVPDTFQYIEELKDYLRAKLSVAPKVTTLKKEEISNLKYPKGSRKPRIFIDLRN